MHVIAVFSTLCVLVAVVADSTITKTETLSTVSKASEAGFCTKGEESCSAVTAGDGKQTVSPTSTIKESHIQDQITMVPLGHVLKLRKDSLISGKEPKEGIVPSETEPATPATSNDHSMLANVPNMDTKQDKTEVRTPPTIPPTSNDGSISEKVAEKDIEHDSTRVGTTPVYTSPTPTTSNGDSVSAVSGKDAIQENVLTPPCSPPGIFLPDEPEEEATQDPNFTPPETPPFLNGQSVPGKVPKKGVDQDSTRVGKLPVYRPPLPATRNGGPISVTVSEGDLQQDSTHGRTPPAKKSATPASTNGD